MAEIRPLSVASPRNRAFLPALMRAIVPRTLFFWVLLRLVVGAAPDVSQLVAPVQEPGAAAPSYLSPAFNALAIVLNTAVIMLLVALDLRATREQLLFANLGVGLREVMAIAACTVLPLELLFLLATAALGGSA